MEYDGQKSNLQDLIYMWTNKQLNNYMINKMASLNTINIICMIYCTYVVHNKQVLFFFFLGGGEWRGGGGGAENYVKDKYECYFQFTFFGSDARHTCGI